MTYVPEITGRPRHRSRKLRQEERDRQAVELFLAGGTYQQIADALGFARKMSAWEAVQRGLSIRHAEWEAGILPHAKTIAWERLERLFARWYPMALGNRAQGIDPDPKALDAVLKVMDRMERIGGYGEPAKVEVSGPGGGPIPIEQAREQADVLLSELAERDAATVALHSLPAAG
jgi:hypothetical protein